MNRRDAIKLGGITAAAAFVGGVELGEPATAWAMNPRFDLDLVLTNQGVIARGPTRFAADEARARVFALVAQRSRVQSGVTGWIDASQSWWLCPLHGETLRPGPADAYGIAYVQNRDGSFEWYPWEVQVTLR